MVWGCLIGWVLASVGQSQVPEAKLPALEVPADLRAALFAMPVQPSPASGVTVRVIDDASQAAIAGAHVFVPDQTKWQAIMSRVPKSPNDLERAMLAPLLWISEHYVTAADGTVVVPATAQPFAYAVTADGFGFAGPDRNAGAEVKQIEARVLRVETFVVRAQSANGKGLAGVGIEIGPYGERGIDRFEPILTNTTDERGEVRMRMPGLMARSFLSKGARICAQARIVSAEPVRVALAAATAGNSTVMLPLPPLGRVVVRLHDEHEKPQSGIELVCLHRAGETPPHRAPEQMPAGWEKPSGDRGDEVRFDVALGQKLVARIRGTGIAGEVVHEQDGPTHEGELVVFAVRVKAASPMLAARLLDAQGMAVVKQVVAVLFVNENLVAQQEATTGADGELRIAIPDQVGGAACRVFVVRRGGGDGADTVYVGAAMRALEAGASGLRDLGELRLQEEPVALAGRLVDAKGAPVAGVAVVMPVTWTKDRGDRISSATKGVLGRALLHRATTDAEGCFVFREIAPRASAGPFEIGGGDWLCEPLLRVETGKLEQRIVAGKAGSVRLTFRTPPPRTMPVQLQSSGKAVNVPIRTDAANGSRYLARVPPGRYDVRLILDGREQRIDGIEIRAGEECADPRLRDIDWAKGLQIVTVYGASTGNIRRLDAKDRTRGGSFGVPSDAEILTFADEAPRFLVSHESYLTILFERPGSEVHVKWVPRRPVRLVLPKGIELPTGLAFELQATAFPASLGPQSRAVWTGAGTEIRADGGGAHRLTLRGGDLIRGAELWWCTVELEAGTEPFEFGLPITAEELKDVREKIAAAKPATSKGR